MPREGHMITVIHMFAYLKQHHNTEMIFDPNVPASTSEMSPVETEALHLGTQSTQNPECCSCPRVFQRQEFKKID